MLSIFAHNLPVWADILHVAWAGYAIRSFYEKEKRVSSRAAGGFANSRADIHGVRFFGKV